MGFALLWRSKLPSNPNEGIYLNCWISLPIQVFQETMEFVSNSRNGKEFYEVSGCASCAFRDKLTGQI